MQLKAEQLHGRIAEVLGLFIEGLFVGGIRLIGIEGVEALEVVQEKIAHIHIGTPIAIHNPLGPLLHSDNGNGNQRQSQDENDRTQRENQKDQQENRRTVELGPQRRCHVVGIISIQTINPL